ncbi:sigma-70 family RNA polymerase sigma factor [Oceanobacillus sp. FSL H7-0719]|uniref:sigma-70 family RNA polymerase sigma factor n=1 Tax=Oceanobacillus sp. FSL H7-0719 TaxID=2954507 RepID=UPI00324340BA
MEESLISDKEQEEYECAKQFVAENELLFRNHLMRTFLLKRENRYLLDQSIRCSTSETKQALDQAFREHVAELRLISQLSNELRRHAIRYDQKFNLYRKKQLLILDQPIHKDGGTSILDVITNEHTSSVDEAALKNSQCLEYHIENPTLYQAILSLTPRQKYILNASYLFNMTDTEIAAKEGVSQQTISKTRNKALRKLRKQLLTEEGKHE